MNIKEIAIVTHGLLPVNYSKVKKINHTLPKFEKNHVNAP